MNETKAIELSKNKSNVTAVKKWWKKGKNVWEISQLANIPESVVQIIVGTL